MGIDRDRAQSLINKALSKNRVELRPKPSIWMRTLSGGLAVACMALVAYFAFQIAYSSRVTPYIEPDLESGEHGVADSLRAEFVPAVWWSAETRAIFDRSRTTLESHQVSLQSLISPSPQERLHSYRDLIRIYLQGDKEAQDAVAPLLAQTLNEDLQTQSSLALELVRPLELSADELPDDIQSYRDAYAANRLLIKCFYATRNAVLRAEMNRLALERTGISLEESEMEYLPLSQTAIAEKQWQHLSAHIYEDPNQASKLVEPLTALTRNRLDHVNDHTFSSVVAILSFKPSVWRNLSDVLKKLVDQATDDQLFELFEQSQVIDNQELVAWLVAAIARRLEIDTQGTVSPRVSAAISENGWRRHRTSKRV